MVEDNNEEIEFENEFFEESEDSEKKHRTFPA